MKEQAFHASRINYIAFIAGLAATFLPILLIERSVLLQTGGIFSYPVDDAFIHMQIADNLSAHGTWGVNSQQFGSASSSILYTLLLALFFKLGTNQIYVPLIINSLAAVALLWVVQRWLARQMLHSWVQTLILVALVFFIPLPVIVISGMEHTLQCLFSFLFLTSFARWYGREDRPSLPWPIIVYAMLAVSVRYECLFMVGMACLLLSAGKEWGKGLRLGIAAFLPVLIFGLISLSKGSYFVPNSLLVKSEAAQFSFRGLLHSFGTILIDRLTFAPTGVTLLATQRILILLALSFFAFPNFLKKERPYTAMLIILMGSVFLQLVLADTGKFYRYEAWLMLSSIAILSVIFFRWVPTLLGSMNRSYLLLAAAVICLLGFPLVLRSLAGFNKASRSAVNIYEQQYQMGQFLHRYYNEATVAANDIGAVSYFTSGEIVDLWGLATIEIARSKKGGYWNAAFLDSFNRSRGTRIAVLYDSWIGKSIPPSWIKIGGWRIFNNVVCGDDVVYFYATNPAEAPALYQSLKSYQPSLPHTVEVTYYYPNTAKL